MLKVKTYLDKSDIHGIGVFADEDIEENQTIWEFDERFDKVIQHNDNEVTFINTYAYYDKQLRQWILPSDNDRFTNHSETPNTKLLDNGLVIALRKISKDEELTVNYYDIDKFAHHKLKFI